MKYFPSIFVLLILFILSCGTSKKISNNLSDDYNYSADTIAYSEELESTDNDTETRTLYQPANTIVNDLVHTKLDVRFDWTKQYLYGKAWLTFKPHFYATDSLRLDAKGMDIVKLEMVSANGNVPLNFIYDSLQLNIALNKSYSNTENYTLYIEYVSKPNDIKAQGSAAITDAKGLYFINADGKDLTKPKQIWTQGETESNSVWFPTIDKPNMKTTLELSITADTGMVTLSNGIMISSIKNTDSTHTDTWKMDQPFAPYLVMMAVGKFSIIKDKWKNIEVTYYVDPEYAPYAKDIFGHTPEMIEFYSKKFGVDYPWPKYSQVIVHDFVSGAMENVSATVHYEALNETHRELIDDNHEDIICHELSHHWFGDLVTCESWSNIPLNESFATYNEVLWLAYKYGKDEGDYHASKDLENYLSEAETKQVPLIRFHYASREDLFDSHSYQKGGYILRMLNYLVGDDAYTAALTLYLNDNKYKTVEYNDLRKSFEAITGKDLHWFFDEWFERKGHPVLDINYEYADSANIISVYVNQSSSSKNENDEEEFIPWKFPLAIDIYSNGNAKRYNVWVDSASKTFLFPAYSKPELVNVDAEKILLCEKTDHKSFDEYLYQYNHAPLYTDRAEAIQYFIENQSQPDTVNAAANNNLPGAVCNALLNCLNDKFWRLRQEAIEGFELNDKITPRLKLKLTELAIVDPSANVRAAALTKLGDMNDSTMIEVYANALNDSSYAVITSALENIKSLNMDRALKEATKFKNEKNESVSSAVLSIYSESGDSTINDIFINKLNAANGAGKFSLLVTYGKYLSKLSYTAAEKNLPYIYDVAENNDQWINRFAASNAIETIKIAWQEKIDSFATILGSIDSSNPGYQKKKLELESFKAKVAQLDIKLEEIQAKEKNDLLNSYYHKGDDK